MAIWVCFLILFLLGFVIGFVVKMWSKVNLAVKFIISVIVVIALALGGLTIANKINERNIHEYIDTFSAVEYENHLVPSFDEDGNAYFVTDGDFRVLHLTDVHIGGGVISARNDKMAINAIAAMVTAEKPDLVVISGDMAVGYPHCGTLNNRYSHEIVAHIMEQLGVYWTVSFGNHDSELYNFYNRSQVAAMYESEELQYCLFKSGPDNIFGEGNHYINVKNEMGLITQSIIVMDTNSYVEDEPLGFTWTYDNIHQDQIDWYENVVKTLNGNNADLLNELFGDEIPEEYQSFTTVKSLLFAHIPIMEVRDAYSEYLAAGKTDTDDVKYLDGVIGEDSPYVFSSEIEEEMFETMLELGSTQAMFFGHDHLNNAVIEYKGITFSYGYSVDYFAYFGIEKVGAQRGCSVVTVHPDATFEIVHENYYQDKYVPLYEKEVVDMTNQ